MTPAHVYEAFIQSLGGLQVIGARVDTVFIDSNGRDALKKATHPPCWIEHDGLTSIQTDFGIIKLVLR